MPTDLDSFLVKKQQEFTAKVGKTFLDKKRISDFRLLFVSACRKKLPGLELPWLHKHTGISKVLLRTYSPEHLTTMLDLYLEDINYRKDRGVSLESFYYASAMLATDLANKAQKKILVAERKEISEPVQPKDSEIETFKKSAFFKKLPKLFQEKINAGKETP